MTPKDKKTLRDAFLQALKDSLGADLPIEGMVIDGMPATQRLIITRSLAQDSFYSTVEEVLSTANITLDKFIEATVAEMKKPRI